MRGELAILPLVLSSSVLVCGCNEIIATGRFEVRDGAVARDAGPMDASARDGGDMDGGGMDAGVDACASNLWYRDSDGDTYGNPSLTMMGCDQPTGYVANADDCDDSTDTIAPGVSEACDDVDQDCDGAVDEGLMGPIGAPISVVDDLGYIGDASADLVAHQDGVTVVWRRSSENVIRAAFFDADGALVRGNVFIEGRVSGGTGPDVRLPKITRITIDGLDQIFIAWVEPDRVRAQLCGTDGTCAFSEIEVATLDTTDLGDLRLAALGEHVIMAWQTGGSVQVVSVDPGAFAASSPITIPPVAGMDTTFAGLATVQSSTESYSLIARTVSPMLEPDAGLPDAGAGPALNEAALVRIAGEASPSWTAADVVPWDFASRCTDGASAACAAAFFGVGGSGNESGANLAAFEGLLKLDAPGGTPTVSLCAVSFVPSTSASPSMGDCFPLRSIASFLAPRGTVATVYSYTGTGYAIREMPLTPDAAGITTAVAVPGIDPIIPGSSSGISMRDNHGAVLGDHGTASALDLGIQRIGCPP
jgi:hypothetical protein